MIVHFDGDLLVYRAGFAAEKMHYYIEVEGEDQHFATKRDAVAFCEEHELDLSRIEGQRIVEPLKNALYNVKSLVSTALGSLGVPPEDMRMYLSGPDNYRNGVATLKPYKGNRDPDHKPVHGPKIKEYMERRFDATYSVNEEADDVVGYSHYAMFKEDPYSSVIISVDKDLDMIPGLHYNFVKDESYFMTEEAADRFFHIQLLTGDSTDNIPGVPKIGTVKATKAIDEAEHDPWEAIVALYVQGYGEDWYEALVENGRLLWIRREPDEWWNPPEHVLEDKIPYE